MQALVEMWEPWLRGTGHRGRRMAGQLVACLAGAAATQGLTLACLPVCFILTLQVSVGSQWLPHDETSQKTSSKRLPFRDAKVQGQEVRPTPEPLVFHPSPGVKWEVYSHQMI